MKQILKLLSLTAAAFTAGAFEGEMTMKMTADGESQEMRFITDGTSIALANPDSGGMMGGGRMILNTESQTMTVVMDEQRMYMIQPLDTMADGESSGPDGKVEDSGETREILGYSCRKVIHTAEDGKVSHLWITTELGLSPMLQLPGAQENMPEGLQEIFGTSNVFPLEGIEFDAEGNELSRLEVTKVEPRKVDPSEVAVPEGYQTFQFR